MSDSDIIDKLGGPSRVAEQLGYSKVGGVQRVQNWKVRGIPARVRLQRPDLFPPSVIEGAPAVPTAEAAHAG